MNQKKILALALAGVLTVSILAGCTKKGSDGQEPTDQPSQSDTDNPGTPETPETNEPENQEGSQPETLEEPDQQPTDTPEDAAGVETPDNDGQPEENGGTDDVAQTDGAGDSELPDNGEAGDTPAAE